MFSKYPMIPVEEALGLIQKTAFQARTSKIPIHLSLSQTLAEDIVSPIDFPPFRASIMDGYAVRSADTPGNLKKSQAVRAGEGLVSVDPGYCVYITTGAAVPVNADAVVPIEEVKIHEDSIEVPKCNSEQWIRPVGSDIKLHETIGKKYDVLTPSHVSLLISVGITEVTVFKQLKVGVISTGNELKDIGNELRVGEIIDSNREMLKMLVAESGCEVVDYGIIQDDYEILKNTMIKISQECDILVSSGGVSMGDRDYVKPIIEQSGDIVFGRVNMKPGKPMTFGKLSNCLVFALPGNPVSCFVCFYLFVRHTIDFILNKKPLPVIDVEIEGKIKLDPRPEYHRAIVHWKNGQFSAVSTGLQQSSRLLSAVQANAIMIFPQATAEKTHITGKAQAILIGKFASLPEERQKTSEHFEKINIKITVGVVTVSDRAYRGEYQDKTGVIFK